MIKVKAGTLYDSKNSFLILISKHLNSGAALKLKRVFFKLRTEWETFEEIRNEKVKLYGTLKEDKEYQISPGDEKWDEFFKEMKTVYDVEINVDINKIYSDELKTSDGKDIDIETMHLITLDWLIDDSKQEPALA